MVNKGLSRLKEIFLYSDSMQTEILVAFCHLIALPASLVAEFHTVNISFFIIAIGSGMFQMWAVLWDGSLTMRLLAVQLATVIAISTIINLSMAGLMCGSRTNWIIIAIFAMWNTIRVFKEKLSNG